MPARTAIRKSLPRIAVAMLVALSFTSCGLVRGISVGLDLALPRLVVGERYCPPPDVVVIDRRPRRRVRRR